MMGRFLLGILLLLVFLSVLLPNTGVAWMRDHWAWFNRPMLWIERMDSVVNIIHAVLFLLLGMATRIALPGWRAGRVAVALLLLGVATELMQLLVPGRNARVSDVVVDLGAGLLGWVAMHVLAGLASKER
jgi:VanZ family protein